MGAVPPFWGGELGPHLVQCVLGRGLPPFRHYNYRGNKYKLINHRFRYDLRKYYFSARIVNIWNSLPNHVVDVNSVNLFKARIDRFWMDQDVNYDFTADLTGTGDRSVNVISET